MKAHEFDRVVTKFGMQTRNAKDVHAWLVVDGKVVVRTRRSHGAKPVLVDFVRQQLKLNQEQFRAAIDCSLDRDGYVTILREKGIL